MPTQISENHDSFIKRFLQDGTPKKIGRTYPNFMKNSEGYIFPISQHLSLIFHHKNGYMLINSFVKAKNFNLFGDLE